MHALLFLASLLLAGDGVKIWHQETGRGTPVIIIHGGPGMDQESLARDLTPLEKHHRVIEYDQRGGGLSTLPADTKLLTIDHHVDDLEALRKHLHLDKVTLIAHSFGPAIAATYAMRYPERVERMIFLSPIPPRKGKFFEEYGTTLRSRVSQDDLARANAIQKEMPESKDVNALCREYWKIMTPPRLAQGVPITVVKSDLCAAPGAAILYGNTKTNPTTFGSLGDWNWIDALAKVKAPTLIIHGEEDAIPMAMVSEWVTALPNARILRLAHTGHFPHAEQPQIVFPAIDKFLGGGWPDGAETR